MNNLVGTKSPLKSAPTRAQIRAAAYRLKKINLLAQNRTSANPSTSNDFRNDLQEFLELRNTLSPTQQRATLTAVPSTELLYKRDESEKSSYDQIPSTSTNTQKLESIQIDDDDEVEEGEIVENEKLSGLVDLLAESFSAVTRSQKLALFKEMFYEDRSAKASTGNVPKYNTYNPKDPSDPAILNVSDEIICLDSSQPNESLDDSVVYVSSHEGTSTQVSMPKPLVYSRPAVKNTKLLAGQSKVISNKSLRFAKWKEKKAKELAYLNTPDETKQMQEPQPIAELPATSQTQEKPLKRIVLIDGSNVAMAYTDSVLGVKKIDKDFSAEGLKQAIDHFVNLGFEVKAIVPEYRVRRDKSSNHELMTQMKNDGKLVCTPSKSYDDRVLLEAAVRLDAAILSNDHFRDLCENPKFNTLVSTRLIRFNWLFKVLIIPEDPYGRTGPKLQDILYKKA